MIKTYILLFVTLLMLFTSCKMQEKEKNKNRRVSNEDLISANRYLVGQDAEAIKGYIERNDLVLEETRTGLWYRIDSLGNGNMVVKGNIIQLDYNIYLLDGTKVYSSAQDGVKEFKVGQGGVESGLEEGVLLLQERTKATFIMPPHLAHGLVGDDNLIPPRATIIYEVEVIDIKE